MHLRSLLFLFPAIGVISACSPRTAISGATDPVQITVPAENEISPTAERYIAEAVAVMRADALYKQQLDFDQIHETIREYAEGAQTVEDTHAAIAKSLPLLNDHHSGFYPITTLREEWGWSSVDVESVKAGIPPNIDADQLPSILRTLDFAEGKLLDDHIGYLSVPPFESMYRQTMLAFADSLQTLIRKMDEGGAIGWIIDLRDNYGGNAMPMIAGLGPLLDDDNSYYGIDETGTVRTQTFYRDGYYDVEDEREPQLLLAPSTTYKVRDPALPIAILTSSKTASSAEAIVAIFKGQPNVRIVGSRTNGLTTVNHFVFLSDNSVLNLTMAHYANRDKDLYIQGIDPDVFVPSEPVDETDDPVLEKAMELIEARY